MHGTVEGRAEGQASASLSFVRWKDALDTSLAELRERVGVETGI
jgi:hypothetical protein